MPAQIATTDIQLFPSTVRSEDGNNGGRILITPVHHAGMSTDAAKTLITNVSPSQLEAGGYDFSKLGIGFTLANNPTLSNARVFFGYTTHSFTAKRAAYLLNIGSTKGAQFDSKQSDISVTTAGKPTARMLGCGKLQSDKGLGDSTLVVDTYIRNVSAFQTGDIVAIGVTYNHSFSSYQLDSKLVRALVLQGYTGSKTEIAEVTSLDFGLNGTTVTIGIDRELSYTHKAGSVVSVSIDCGNVNCFADSMVATAGGMSYSGTIGVTPSETIVQEWRIAFTGGGNAFSVFGDTLGLVGSGNTTSDCVIYNSANNKIRFVIPSSGWSGTPSSTAVLKFRTYPAIIPVWIAEQWEAGAEGGETFWSIGIYGESP